MQDDFQHGLVDVVVASRVVQGDTSRTGATPAPDAATGAHSIPDSLREDADDVVDDDVPHEGNQG